MWWPFRRTTAPEPPPTIARAEAEAIADRFFLDFFRADVPRRGALARRPGQRGAWVFSRTEPDGRIYTHRGGNIRLVIDAATGAVTGLWLERR